MAHLPQPDPRFLKALRSLEEAVQCQREGRVGEAERLFTRLLKKNPDYFDALHFFGLFRYQQGELNEALKLLTRAVKVHPRSADAYSNLGVTLDALQRPRDALAAYDRALALNPDHVRSLGNRGNALSLLNRHEDAIASDRALLAPDFVDALTNAAPPAGAQAPRRRSPATTGARDQARPRRCAVQSRQRREAAQALRGGAGVLPPGARAATEPPACVQRDGALRARDL